MSSILYHDLECEIDTLRAEDIYEASSLDTVDKAAMMVPPLLIDSRNESRCSSGLSLLILPFYY